MLGHVEQFDRGIALGRRGRAQAGIGAPPARQIGRGERVGALHQRRRRAEEHDLATALARTRTHVEQAIGREHDLRIVFDHHQRIAGVAQLLHHRDHPPHVARMQADRRLVEHEQRVDE